MFFHFAGAILLSVIILTGCAPQVQRPIRICPGAESTIDSLSLLRMRTQNTVSLKANGQCLAKFYVEDKLHKENFPVKLWFNPPCQIRLQGNVAFNARGIDLGSNEREFWLAMKPKEIGNSYFWGRWSEGTGLGELKISPKILLEAFGIIGVDGQESWSLSNDGGFDILTKRNSRGMIIKKVHIYNCDYRISKIEYFGDNGQAVVVMELGEYKDVCAGVLVPKVIKIISFNGNGTEDSFRITLRSVKAVEFNKKIFFNRPEPRGFKHIYKIIDGEMVEQQQRTKSKVKMQK